MALRLNPGFVQSVRDAIDLVDVVSEHTRLERRGQRLLGLCPFHKEKTPSFSVDPSAGLYHCFGCGAGGDGIRFHMQVTGDDFAAAMESLARRYGVPLPVESGGAAPGTLGGGEALDAAQRFFRASLERSPVARRYLEKRQVDPALVEAYGLGYAPDDWRQLTDALAKTLPLSALEAAGLVARSEKASGRPYDRFRNRLMFPIRNASGRLLGFGGRTLGDDPAKYVNTRETAEFQKGSILYGLDRARATIREGGAALLVEGYFDVIGSVQSGVTNAIASMGTALTAHQAKLLARYADLVIIGYDGDRAGEEASLKALPLLLAEGLVVKRARFPAGQDPDSLRLEEGPEAVRQAVAEARDFLALEVERIPPATRDDPQRVAAAAERLRPLLAAVRDPSLRASYERMAAERLGVPVGLAGGRVPRLLRRSAQTTTPSSASAPSRGLEERVLALLLGGARGTTCTLPSEEVFWDEDTRAIYAALRSLGSRATDRQGAEAGSLGDAIARALPAASSALTLLARLRDDLPQSPIGREEELEEQLDHLVNRTHRRQLQRLASEIQEAQRSGDSVRLLALVEERERLKKNGPRAHRPPRVGT
jgi:DNA primase